MSSPYLHWLRIRVPKENLALIDEFRKENENARYALSDDGDADQDCSWWDCTKDLVEFSKKHPEVVFEMEIQLEGSSDDWCKEFVQDGKIQVVNPLITWPRFLRKKLKPWKEPK